MHASKISATRSSPRACCSSSDVERLEHLGVLGPDMVMIHMGWASPKEIFLAQKHGFKISYTPSTGFRLGMGDTGFGHFPEMAAIGVTVSLSCNSAMSSNYLNMVRLMNLGAGAMRATRLSAFSFPPEEMIEMATINGAVAVGAETGLRLDRGREEGGSRVVRHARAGMAARCCNPLSNLVHSARGGAHTVIVDGKVLMANGKVQTIDEAETLAECQRRGVLMARKSGLDRVAQSPWPRQ